MDSYTTLLYYSYKRGVEAGGLHNILIPTNEAGADYLVQPFQHARRAVWATLRARCTKCKARKGWRGEHNVCS